MNWTNYHMTKVECGMTIELFWSLIEWPNVQALRRGHVDMDSNPQKSRISSRSDRKLEINRKKNSFPNPTFIESFRKFTKFIVFLICTTLPHARNCTWNRTVGLLFYSRTSPIVSRHMFVRQWCRDTNLQPIQRKEMFRYFSPANICQKFRRHICQFEFFAHEYTPVHLNSRKVQFALHLFRI